MLRRALTVWLFSAFVLFASATQSFANLILNPSFETGDFASWTQFGNTDFTNVIPGGTDGAFQATFGPIGSTGGISQIIATSPGQSYLFSFDVRNDSNFFGSVTPNSFAASFDGAPVLSLVNSPAFAYTHHEFSVVASGALTAVSFTFQHDPFFYFLDNVSVVAPEPATLLLFTGGLAGIAYRRRRKV
jgi:hypothetical protein